MRGRARSCTDYSFSQVQHWWCNCRCSELAVASAWTVLAKLLSPLLACALLPVFCGMACGQQSWFISVVVGRLGHWCPKHCCIMVSCIIRYWTVCPKCTKPCKTFAKLGMCAEDLFAASCLVLYMPWVGVKSWQRADAIGLVCCHGRVTLNIWFPFPVNVDQGGQWTRESKSFCKIVVLTTKGGVYAPQT